MELGAKRKWSRASGSGLAVDRLSALPDCLLHVIMSFMKARQVVQTCALSKRWEHLWRTVPCLDIDQREFQKTGESADKVWENFEDFTDNLMFRHEIARLDMFRLHVNDGYYWGRSASRWIRCSIKYSAKVPGIPRLGLSFSSWSLKRLQLSNVDLDDLFAKHIRSRCCSLEDLDLKRCRLALDEIESHSLKNLVIDDCHRENMDDMDEIDYHSKLIVTAPAIASLYLKSFYFCGGLFVIEMPSLSKASILVLHNFKGSTFHSNQFKFLSSLCNVTTLELSGFQTMVIPEEQVELPEFKNLKILSLDKCDLRDNFQLLMHFLLNSPNLEKITLRLCKLTKDSKKRKGKAKQKKTSLGDIQCQNLKFTEIIYDVDDVLQLVEFLLGYSVSLPKNNIKLTKADDYYG
ncbi:hypothetical protein E2562_038013 [Oryza meyeriana var. granulata]|uniref:F-box domain-containing protein n=1 Tax=Oryza meyeriana var. granulata TaxID=110450 RepID=A0A6G1F270_9ORYZ|nr:hypothetical protein E2562_038013 [Oryza meyeriana var. granulata]KAF0930936.1 hypothetical protein E2562_038013 [Oryza meyeriana var. granulata]